LQKLFEKFLQNPLTNAAKCGIIIMLKGRELETLSPNKDKERERKCLLSL
jgi:hypothetical protein